MKIETRILRRVDTLSAFSRIMMSNIILKTTTATNYCRLRYPDILKRNYYMEQKKDYILESLIRILFHYFDFLGLYLYVTSIQGLFPSFLFGCCYASLSFCLNLFLIRK